MQRGRGSRGGTQLARSEEQLAWKYSGKREQERQHCGDEKEAEDSQSEERS